MSALRYPLYVISKGRAGQCLTARVLERDGVPYRLVVEPQEREAYLAKHPAAELLVLPFSNLGKGGIPARNWVWEHAKAAGAERHWILDDNIKGFYRRWCAQKFPCDAGPAFTAIEDFVDRYENVAVAGMQYYMFVPNHQKHPPFVANCHVYSNLLIRNDLPQRWRGRYNEDTDLCLQVLAAGWCTMLFNAFLADKMTTMKMKGGNSDELYKGDGRLKMARSLERRWPGVVETKRRFQRPQHVVHSSWAKFDTQLKLKPGVDLAALAARDERGLDLVDVKEAKSPTIKRLRERWREGTRAPSRAK